MDVSTSKTSELNLAAVNWLNTEGGSSIPSTKSESMFLCNAEGGFGALERYLVIVQMHARLSVFNGDKRDYQSCTFESCVVSKVTSEGEKLESLLQYIECEAKVFIEIYLIYRRTRATEK